MPSAIRLSKTKLLVLALVLAVVGAFSQSNSLQLLFEGGVARAQSQGDSIRDAPQITSLTHPTRSSVTVNWLKAGKTDEHWIYSVKADGSVARFHPAVRDPPPPGGAGGQSEPVTEISYSTTVIGLDVDTQYWFAVIGVNPPFDGSPKEWFSWSNWATGVTRSVRTVSTGQDVSVTEGATANIAVIASVAPQSEITVNYAIEADSDASTTDGDSDDYAGSSTGSIVIPRGATQGTIPVVIIDDSDIDDGTRETLIVTITVPDSSGYEIGEDTSATITIKEGICDRTTEVRDLLLNSLTHIVDCAEVTDADLSGITEDLDLSGQHISVKQGDFGGLASLTTLRLNSNYLSSLPEDMFNGLTDLERLRISNNSLTSLPKGVFHGLTSLQELRLSNNFLASLPEGVFDGLTGLQELRLSNNYLSSLPKGMFDGLTSLRDLRMQSNPGDPFIYTAEVQQTARSQVKVVASDAVPFDLTVSLSIVGGTLSADSVVVPAGTDESSVITMSPAPGGGPVKVSATAASFPASGVKVSGVQAGVGIANQTPDANAGVDQEVAFGREVTLDASKSNDFDAGDTLSYIWIQTAGPAISLNDNTSANPTFTAPSSTTTLTFLLTVLDGRGGSDTDTVSLSILANRTPTADAGRHTGVEQGATIVLDGSGSFDPDGDMLTYSWIQLSGPRVILTDVDTVSPTFMAPTGMSSQVDVRFRLTVSDGISGSHSHEVWLTVLVRPPTADAGSTQTVGLGSRVTLDGSNSSDPDEGDSLTYQWEQIHVETITLSDATSARASFTAPSGPAYIVFRLTVTDLSGQSHWDEVIIWVRDTSSASNAVPGSNQSVDMGTRIAFALLDEHAPDVDV